MPRRLLLAFLVLVATSALAASPAGVTVVLIRHAEAESTPGDPGLSIEGLERADCWRRQPQLAGLTHVFSSPYHRALETATVASLDGDLEVQQRDPMKAAELAAELRALPAGSRALVVGHSNTVPMLASALGVTLTGLTEEAGQIAIPRAEHDRLAVIELPPGDGAPKLTESRQDCTPPAKPAKPASAAAPPKVELERRISLLGAAMKAWDAKALHALRTPEFRGCVTEAQFADQLAQAGEGRFTKLRPGARRELVEDERDAIPGQCSAAPLAPERAVAIEMEAKIALPDGSVHPVDDLQVFWVLIDGEWWCYDWGAPSLSF